jgi:hypothetical protein
MVEMTTNARQLDTLYTQQIDDVISPWWRHPSKETAK